MPNIPAVRFCCAAALALGAALPAAAQSQRPAPVAAPLPSYASIARLVLTAPLIIDATVTDATKLKPQDSPGLAAGRMRFYVEASVGALIRGKAAIPTAISFLADIPLDSHGKPPKLKKARLLLFARPIPGHPDQVQLTGIDSQRGWTPGLDELVRRITREVLAGDAPPEISGLGNAFHVPGSLPGEGETQIFVMTASGAPISLQVLRRPGERPRWSVSLGDIVDESAGAPPKDTLLWFRLACGLPKQLPAASLDSEDPPNARAAREDYQLVLRELGPCQ